MQAMFGTISLQLPCFWDQHETGSPGVSVYPSVASFAHFMMRPNNKTTLKITPKMSEKELANGLEAANKRLEEGWVTRLLSAPLLKV